MELIDALNQGISAGRSVALCFNPRHAIRARKGNETVELLICFECGQIYITSHSATNQLFMTTGDPAVIFNKILMHSRVPLAERLYYVDGEVAHPGPEKYLSETTVVEAIFEAGGFTPFASHKVLLRRADGTRVRLYLEGARHDPAGDTPVFPGDVIYAARRIF